MFRLALTFLLVIASPLAASGASSPPPPAGVVTVEIYEEGVPKDNSWPTQPGVTET